MEKYREDMFSNMKKHENMVSDIVPKRRDIHNNLVSYVFQNRDGKNFKRLNGRDIENVFDLYDEEFFDNEIRNRFVDGRVELKFIASTQDHLDYAGICKIKPHSKEGFIFKIHLYILPNMIPVLICNYRNKMQRILHEDQVDRVFCLQLIVERYFSYLLMVLEEFSCMIKKGDYDYSPMQLQKKYLYENFGYRYDEDLDFIEFINDTNKLPYLPSHQPPKKHINDTFKKSKSDLPGLFINNSSSCYLDSLLISLFFGTSDFPRKIILESDTSLIDYRGWDEKELSKDLSKRKIKVFKGIPNTERLYQEDDVKKFAEILQINLVNHYKILTEKKENITCESRLLISHKFPAIGNFKKGFGSFPVADIYSFFTDIFPDLKMWYIPTKIIDSKGKIKRSKIEERTTFLFWDFIEPSLSEGSHPIWEEIKSPLLVFQNGLVPPIKNYGEIGTEIIVTQGLLTPDSSESKPKFGFVKKQIEKENKFGEYIINDKYRLFAVIRNHGIRPITSGIHDFGGGHYTVYIRPIFDVDKWYFYDDLHPFWVSTKKGVLPENTFVDDTVSRPELLFYEKVK